MRRFCLVIFLLLSLTISGNCGQRWTEAEANAWYARQPWLIGANYIPTSAVNVLEMWQEPTFDPASIDRELGWAESLGMNTVRVFLHDLLWQQDAEGFKRKISTFLAIADTHRIRSILVLFDSCWDPFPRLGAQPPPRPGIHNSRWVQSPGAIALASQSEHGRLEAYVKGVVAAFATDARVLAWDIWNEPDNVNEASYGSSEPGNKKALVEAILPDIFAWVRTADATQPVTSGVWRSVSSLAELSPLDRLQIANSDVISFHNYETPRSFERQIQLLKQYGRPVLCTEYLARPVGSTFEGILPLARKHGVAAINWGLVAGKTQTYLPWDSWQNPYVDREPAIWFHEVFRSDGTPYRPEEVQLFRTMTGLSPPAAPAPAQAAE